MSTLITLEAVDLVLRVAKSRVGACEVPANSNAGPFVERVLKNVGLGKGYPWCAADVFDIGTIALDDRWPLPKTASCAALGEFATAHNILVEKPQRGDVFLLWEKVGGVWRFAHTGFVELVHADGACDTSEGNTNGAGSRDGWLHWEKTRYFAAKDRFVRWTNLLSPSSSPAPA